MSAAPEAELAAELQDEELTPSSEAESASSPTPYADLVGNSLLESLGYTEDEEPSTETDETTPQLEASATTPATATVSAEEQMARWVDQFVENPKTITRIPQKLQGDVVAAGIARREALAAQALESAVTAAQQRGEALAQQRLQQEQQRQQDAQLVTAIDARKAQASVELAGPDGTQQWMTGAEWYGRFRDSADPADVAMLARYDAARNAIRNPQGQQVDVAAIQAQATLESAAALKAELDQYPAAVARLQVKLAAEPGRYAINPEGLRRFTADVTREIAAEQIAAEAKKNAPAQAALQQRQANTAGLRATPRVDVSTGRGSVGEPLTDDINELLRMGFAEHWKKPMQEAV